MKKFNSIDEMFEDIKKNHTLWDKIILHPSMNWLRWLIYNAIDVPNDFYRKCKRGWQRAYRGWADEDTWHLDGYLARIIKESVTYLKSYNNGYPSDLTEKEWNEILSDIIYTFDRIDAQNRLDVIFIDQERVERGWIYFKKHFRSLWD
jgi:hypothetical protein